jgi:hypothetical protein
VLRAGLLKLVGGMLGQLLAADPGYRGPRADCGQGHDAEFVAYRDKVIDTVLGPVTLTRAWYHCAQCGHGLAPRDAELSVAGVSVSPGLAAMTDLAAADGPFAKASRMLEAMAGVPAAPTTASGSNPATRQAPPDRHQPRPAPRRAANKLAVSHLQNCRAPLRASGQADDGHACSVIGVIARIGGCLGGWTGGRAA